MISIIQQKHKDRYRIQFCDENFYHRYQNVFEMWQNRFKSLEKVEKLQAWVTVLSCLRRSNDWYGGPRAVPLVNPGISFINSDTSPSPDKIYTHSMTLADLFEGSPIVLPAKLSGSMNLFSFLSNHRIKALPESCFRSLCYMRTGRYPLRLSSGVVSPFELLQIQLRGERIVSMDEDFREWPTRLYSDRDYLGFVLHDLIHADHFFFEPKHRDGQLGFYRFVNSSINDASLQKLLNNFPASDAALKKEAAAANNQAPENFRAGFEYIISDMNSHPLHLFQTLHSLLFKTMCDDAAAFEIWLRWIALAEASVVNFPAAEFGSSVAGCAAGGLAGDSGDELFNFSILKRINARDFSFEESLAVENLCQKLAEIPNPKPLETPLYLS